MSLSDENICIYIYLTFTGRKMVEGGVPHVAEHSIPTAPEFQQNIFCRNTPPTPVYTMK
jgi:hypothetical protein